jgi:hypothetical protein
MIGVHVRQENLIDSGSAYLSQSGGYPGGYPMPAVEQQYFRTSNYQQPGLRLIRTQRRPRGA